MKIATLFLTAFLASGTFAASEATNCSSETAHASAGHHDTLVDVALEAGSFKTLAAALEAANLVDVLKGDDTFTVFAPTDDAFAKLPEGTVESLLEPENKDLLTAASPILLSSFTAV